MPKYYLCNHKGKVVKDSEPSFKRDGEAIQDSKDMHTIGIPLVWIREDRIKDGQIVSSPSQR